MNQIIEKFGLINHPLHLFAIYPYGSRVYDNNTIHSDFDYIIVRRQISYKIDGISVDNMNATFYSPQGFQKAIDEHEISVLECLFLPDHKKILETDFKFVLNLSVLRKSISAKSSNSFVKAKKKLIDNEVYIAQKSLFHSLRIIMFGIQIAKYGKIVDYTESNLLWEEIKSIEVSWDMWKEKYQQYQNNLLSEFRILAPK